MGRQSGTVAILGGGPAGSSLATYLARAARNVVPFATVKRPPIIVGESIRNRCCIGLMSFMARHGLAGNDPERLRIH